MKKNINSSRLVNQVEIRFTEKLMTAYGGIAALVAKYLEEIDFRIWVEKHIPIKEKSNNAKGIYGKVIAQFLTILSGGYRFSHLGWWGHGKEVLQQTFGISWLPQASSVLTRFWGKIDTQKKAESLGVATRELAKMIIGWDKIRKDNLNFDSSVIVRYGKQQGAHKGYNPQKPGRPSHHPLIAFLGSGYVVNLQNRSGDTSSAKGIVDFFKQTRKVLGRTFSPRRILADTGFYLVEFLEHLESEKLLYIIAAPLSHVLQREIRRVQNWHKLEPGIEVAWFYFQHQDKKWTKKRRYVVVRQSKKLRPKASGKQPSLFVELDNWKDYRFSLMITDDEQTPPEEIWRSYRPRANDENVIKELKQSFGLKSFCLDNFWATESVMLMNALVFHNLIHYLSCNVLSRNSKLTLQTLRGRYFILPASLGSQGRRKVLRLATKSKKLRSKITSSLEKIALLSHKLNCIAFDSS